MGIVHIPQVHFVIIFEMLVDLPLVKSNPRMRTLTVGYFSDVQHSKQEHGAAFRRHVFFDGS